MLFTEALNDASLTTISFESVIKEVGHVIVTAEPELCVTCKISSIDCIVYALSVISVIVGDPAQLAELVFTAVTISSQLPEFAVTFVTTLSIVAPKCVLLYSLIIIFSLIFSYCLNILATYIF